MENEAGTMYIQTGFVPIRMLSGQREPVALHVEVRNKTDQTRNYSISTVVPSKFGFDKAGLMREKRIRVRNVPPGESKTAIFNIYGKFNVPPDLYNVDLIIREHGERFDKVINQEKFNTSLRVEEP